MSIDGTVDNPWGGVRLEGPTQHRGQVFGWNQDKETEYTIVGNPWGLDLTGGVKHRGQAVKTEPRQRNCEYRYLSGQPLGWGMGTTVHKPWGRGQTGGTYPT